MPDNEMSDDRHDAVKYSSDWPINKPGRRIKRAARRWHLRRMKRKSAYLYQGRVKFADHLASCSGPCCGNYRQYEGKTIQELVFWSYPVHPNEED